MKDESTRDDIQFFLTPKHLCSYLPRNNAQTLFFDPRRAVTPAIYQQLADQGFRRSGSHLYRPHCADCQACIPVRVPVDTFTPKRTQRRVARKNVDLRIEIEEAQFSPRHYALYERYVSLRHADGDMFPASEDQYRSFLLSPWSDSVFVSLYDQERLVSVAVTDRQVAGLSAIYTFFEPDLADRSLGVFSILSQIQLAREWDLPYLYLGYWIRECQKMAYKSGFRPAEYFVEGRWVQLR